MNGTDTGVLERATSHHRLAMELVDRAMTQHQVGRESEAASSLRRASLEEQFAALSLASFHELEPTRSVMLRSAASLAVECGKLDEASLLIEIGLEGSPPDEIRRELAELKGRVELQFNTGTSASGPVSIDKGARRGESPSHTGKVLDLLYGPPRDNLARKLVHSDVSQRGAGNLTRVFQALSDSTRQEILRLLDSHQLSLGEIVDSFHLSQPTISRHLAVLQEAGLVVDERSENNVFYRLNSVGLTASMRTFFKQFHSCEEALRQL